MDKLQVFAAANGWTVDNFDTTNDKLSMHRGTIYCHFHWDNTDQIAIFQSLGFVAAGTDVDSHTDDSGNTASPTGAITANIGHYIDLDNGGYTAYHFFDDNSGTYPYLHVVVEHDVGFYRHFSMGEIQKFGTWTGGEYFVGHIIGASQLNSPYRNERSILWDGAVATRGGYLHLEGLPNQTGSGKWGVFGDITGSRGNDSAAVARVPVVGGVRNAPYEIEFIQADISSAQAFIPFTPIPIFYLDTSTTPDHMYLLGYAPDVRIVNNKNYVDGQEITFGGDTWIVFPQIRKAFSGLDEEQSSNFGFAYKKLV